MQSNIHGGERYAESKNKKATSDNEAALFVWGAGRVAA